MLYQKPRMEILKVELRDVLCASVEGYYGEDKKNDDYSDTEYEIW